MKKFLLLLFTSVFLFINAQAQLTRTDSLRKALETQNKDTVAWVHGGLLSIGINQGFLHNWAAGGEIASVTVNGIFNGFLTRINHNKVWSNNLDLTYSMFYAYSNFFVPRKIDDRIDFTSKYGVQLDSGNFYFTGLFNFKTQFTEGYDYNVPNWDSMPASNFLSPAYFTLALGMEYRRGTNLSLFLSPVAARITLADPLYTSRRPEGAFGIQYGEHSRFELGAYFSGRYIVDISKNISYRTRLDLYSNYLAKDQKDSLGNIVKRNHPGNIDILWDNLFSFKLAKFFSITFAATMIYDNDLPYYPTYENEVGEMVEKDEPGKWLGWWQTKQLLTVGFEYRF